MVYGLLNKKGGGGEGKRLACYCSSLATLYSPIRPTGNSFSCSTTTSLGFGSSAPREKKQGPRGGDLCFALSTALGEGAV